MSPPRAQNSLAEGLTDSSLFREMPVSFLSPDSSENLYGPSVMVEFRALRGGFRSSIVATHL